MVLSIWKNAEINVKKQWTDHCVCVLVKYCKKSQNSKQINQHTNVCETMNLSRWICCALSFDSDFMYEEMSGRVSQLVQVQQEGRSHRETNNFLPLLTKPDTEQVESTGWTAA